jgi:hypothetical protein
VVDVISVYFKPGDHFPVAVERRAGVLLVDQPHQLKVQGAFTRWLAVERGPVETDEFALTANAEYGMLRFNHHAFGLKRLWQLFFSATQAPS